MLKFGRNADVWLRFWNLMKICVRTYYFGKQNSTLGSVVPLAMFLRIQVTMYPVHDAEVEKEEEKEDENEE